jgi:hypothetical protein
VHHHYVLRHYYLSIFGEIANIHGEEPWIFGGQEPLEVFIFIILFIIYLK